MSTCLVAEKPSVARAIAATLGSPQKAEGYLTVGDTLITWAFGHLVTLADPETYDPAWKRWSFTTLPMLPDPFQLGPVSKSAAQLQIVTGLLNRPTVTTIICATDADREGELIFRYIVRHAQCRKPVQRLWLSETTPSAIRTALASMKPASAYDALGHAAEARSQADWLVGLNATRAFTLRHGVPGQGALSVGRVQTPTLRLIADRDATRAAFTPVPYWQVAVTFQAPEGLYVGRWTDPTQPEHPERIPTAAQAQAVGAQVPAGTPGQIQFVERKRVRVPPPRLFSLNDLQKEAHRRFGLTAQQTLDTAQSLYEQHLTSYPRTDARSLTADVAATLPERLQGLKPAYAAVIGTLSHPLPVSRVVDEAQVAQAGHHAIIPTGQRADGLPDPERQVYDLIVRRCLAALGEPGEDERTTIRTQAGGETFVTTGTAILTPGWRIAVQDLPDETDGDASPAIPAGLHDGEAVTVQQADIREKTTKPPPALNDASVLGLMDKHGLGTPATRARILEGLCLRGYVVRQKKSLVTTEKGRAVLQVVPDALQSPALTGQWEAQLEAIAQGQGDPAVYRQIEMDTFSTEIPHFQRVKVPTFSI